MAVNTVLGDRLGRLELPWAGRRDLDWLGERYLFQLMLWYTELERSAGEPRPDPTQLITSATQDISQIAAGHLPAGGNDGAALLSHRQAPDAGSLSTDLVDNIAAAHKHLSTAYRITLQVPAGAAGAQTARRLLRTLKNAILKNLHAARRPLTGASIARGLDREPDYVRHGLSQLMEDGVLVNDQEGYRLAPGY